MMVKEETEVQDKNCLRSLDHFSVKPSSSCSYMSSLFLLLIQCRPCFCFPVVKGCKEPFISLMDSHGTQVLLMAHFWTRLVRHDRKNSRR
jgi:hypothetical protein